MVPSGWQIGEKVRETLIVVPSFRTRVVSTR